MSAHFYLNLENVVAPVVAGMGYELVDLQSSNATIVLSSNTTSAFFEVAGNGTESGTAAGLYSATLGGDENAGFWVKISFDGNPQPILTSAFLKAGNGYLWWDAADLAPFNAGTYDSIVLWNNTVEGIRNSNGKYKGTSHAGLVGTLGTVTHNVPDDSATISLLGLGVIGLAVAARRRAAK